MKNKFLYGIITIAIVGFTGYNISQNKVKKNNVVFSILDLDKQVNAEINYHVPDKTNNPKSCTISADGNASGSIGGGEASVGGSVNKQQGIKNTCKGGSAGCDPYNCHKRV